MKHISGQLLLPFLLTLLIIVVDQITKQLVVAYIEPVYERGFQLEVFGEFLRIIHARNPGIAFSLGAGLPRALRQVLFTLFPLAVIVVLLFYYLRSGDRFSRLERWSIAGIAGGGIGNLIDRVFRPEGVVDFVDVKFYGLFGLERWPTFNVADASVVVCGILLVFSIFMAEARRDS
ncbi:MAG: signal peptidase II [Spirochaetaceae bacterium]